MLAVADLHHRFGERTALDGVSISAAPGEIVGLVGRNGAGKTTTMRSIMGIVVPDRGAVTWGGRPVTREERLRFGYMPEERGLYPQMALSAQVVFFGRLHGMDEPAARRAVIGSPDATWIHVLAFVPLLTPQLAPALIAVGHIPVWEIVAQAAILLGSIYLTVRVASRIYAAGLVRGGPRIPWKAALRLRPATAESPS